jgi:hypothetical protein
MFTIPFLSSPFGYSLQAYKSTRVEIPIVANTLFRQRRVYKGSEEYDQAITTLAGCNIKTELQPFFDRMGVRKDLIVIERFNFGFCAAQGTNFFTKGDAIISVAPNFQNVDKDACHWAMKHETCHIKNNDCFTMPLVPAICSIAAATFSTFLMPVIPTLLVTISIGCIAQAIFSQYREGKADDLAIAESSVEELKGGRRFLMALKAANLEARKTTWKKLVISSTGENRLDFLHPSTASRLRKIEHVLKQKNIGIDDQEESEKIAKLENLMDETILKLENEFIKFWTHRLRQIL